MKIINLILGLVLLAGAVFAQTPEPTARTNWYETVDWIKNGQMTLTYKTLTSPTITGPTFSGSITTTGVFDQTITGIAAAGDKAVNTSITQGTSALTGNLIAGAFVATNGTAAASGGVIYGIEAKARAATSGGTGNTIGRLTGVYASVDAKAKTATTMRAFEASLDGGAGGSSTEAVAFEAFNNSSATQIASYAFSANAGTASGHKAYTADMRMQNGALIDNAVDGVLEINEASDELKATFGSNTVTVSSTDVTAFNFNGGIATTWNGATSGGIKIAPIATGTALTTIQNQNVAAATITLPNATSTLPGLELANIFTGANNFQNALFTHSYDAAAYWTATQADAAGVTFNSTSDGTAGFTFSDAVTFSAGINTGTSQSIVGTTAVTLGDNNQTWAVNSSDWDVSTTGDLSGIGSISANGALTLESSRTGGASVQNSYKMTLAAGESFSGTTGHIFKVYDADNTVVHNGGEHTGVYVNMKQLSAMQAGGKSVLFSGHNYGSGGDYQIIDAGVWLYGNLVDAYKISGGSIDTGLDLSETTVTGQDLHLHNGATINNVHADTLTVTESVFKVAGGLTFKNSPAISITKIVQSGVASGKERLKLTIGGVDYLLFAAADSADIVD